MFPIGSDTINITKSGYQNFTTPNSISVANGQTRLAKPDHIYERNVS